MDAERFPITTPYGQVPGYELNNGWHRGEDRAMPMDTPVLVNGHEIGLSGNSGQVTGPHLHIGRFVGSQDTPPNGGGFHFSSAVVTEVSEDPVNGKFVRVQADGASWVYLHLSRQTVPVGQELVPLILQAPAPPPTPVSYNVVETYNPGKQIKLNKQPTYLWGMNYHFDEMVDNPVETHDKGEVWIVTNKVHHEDGYDYYRREGQVDGFNVADCDDYVYKPPAAPEPIRLATKVTLVTAVPYYITAQTAQSGYKSVGTLQPRDEDYYQISTDLGMLNLSTDNMKDAQQWINPRDNELPEPVNPPAPTKEIPVPPIDPEPVTGTEANQAWKQYYRAHPTVDKYTAIHSYLVADIDGSKATMELPAYQPPVFDKDGKVVQKAIGVVDVYGTFPGPDGTRYYRVKPKNDRPLSDAWYGIPILDKNGLPILRKEPTIKPATAAPIKQKASNKDTIHLITAHLEAGVPKFIDIIPRWYKQIKSKE